MLQMTSIELNDLIQTELLSNPILEEVAPQDEEREISEKIIDQYADGENTETPVEAFSESFQSNSFEIDHEFSENGNGNLADSNISEINDFAPAAENDFESYGEDGFDGEVDFEKRDAFEEIDFGREFQEYLDPGYKTQEFEYKEDAPSFEQFLTKETSLAEHLEWQVSLCQIPERLAEIAYEVIGNLDNDGRLKASNEELAYLCGCSVEAVEKARLLIMQLEPTGCGARDVRECLIVQLEAAGHKDSHAARIVRDFLHELQPHRLHHLAKQTGLSIDTLNEQLALVRTLNPYPGRLFSHEAPVFIAPEIYIEKIDEDYVIYFADDGSPRLRISPSYQQMLAKGEASKETRDFIKDKVRSAVDLLRNIEHRRQTIYRVVECIVQKQNDFLDKGVQFIKPMMLKDIAEEIGLHLSTISRVVNRKYAHTPQGVIELRRFFSEGMLNEDGEEVSTRIIKLRIKKLIEEENTSKPITDDDIAKILIKEGIKLSRRTVAKYRDQMHIAGSRERKVVV